MQKTPKDFDQRNEHIKQIEFLYTTKKGDVGEFRWYREGMNVGSEVSKNNYFKRVCLILHTHFHNGLILVAPITTKFHKHSSEYLLPVNSYEKYGLKECWIMINQIKLIDPKRLHRKTGEYRSHVSLATIVKKRYVALFWPSDGTLGQP